MSRSSSAAGYYRWPAVHGDRVVFVSEDDLWEVPLQGGAARRLTSGLGEARYPAFSPDGSKLAYIGSEEGTTEVFVMDADGGPGTQLTYHGTLCAVVGWSPDGERIRFRTNHGQYSPRITTLFEISPEGGQAANIGLGKAHWFDEEPGGTGRVIGRHADDLARWKRYRGGTAGALWIDRGSDDGEGWERLLPDLTSGLVRPMWIGDRIYFMNDENGYGNIWSVTPDGADLTQHTEHRGFYVRGAQTDGTTIVYTVGGDLWRFDVASGEANRIECTYHSPRTQMNRKFVDADDYLQDWSLHPKGHSLAVSTRGKLFNLGNWEGAVRQTGEPQGVRYRLPLYLDDGKRLLVVSDVTGEERLELHTTDGSEEPEAIEHGDIGRPLEIGLAPDDEWIALSNHRNELVFVELETGETKVLASSMHRIDGLDWSADSRWVAYSVHDTWKTSLIRVVDTNDWSTHDMTEPGFRDVQPCFDPDGRYLYFISARWFDPVYDSLFFELSFPKSARPCVLTLTRDETSPFFEEPRPLNGDDSDGEDSDDENGEDSESGDSGSNAPDDENDSDDDEPKPVEIDFDGIGQRMEAFPVPVGHYGTLRATSDRVFWSWFPDTEPRDDDDDSPGRLQYFDLEKRKKKTFTRSIDEFDLSADRKTLVYDSDSRLRVVSASADGPNDDSDRASRESGWIDLGRVPVAIEPRREWRQMLREAWRLMRDHYWSDDLCGVDWPEVWERYEPLVDRVSSRGEFSDLVWTMQGELGTSHAYEIGGDYRRPPRYRPGALGADFEWDAEAGGYRIEHIVRGPSWLKKQSSPLTAPGVNVEEGEIIVAINGRRLDEMTSVNEALVHVAGQEIELTIRGTDGESRTRTVKALRSEFGARYREWVDENRRRVHDASDGRLGYVHVPDMSAQGFAEFHRGFLSELSRKGLVVDVRNNGGGHVSQLILEKLARRQIGYDVGRWTQPLPYPEDSIPGPIVAVTDENAGSDGDIFSHCFKLMDLGPLVGKRTWGGVVGIWPRHDLVDGSFTTQPEFAFWFEDVGFGVENYGTDPDVEVEFPPEAQARGEDPQLDRAIEIALEELESSSAELPEFGPPPQLAPPVVRPPSDRE